MADLRLRATQFLFFFLIRWTFVCCIPVKISVDSVPASLIETALQTLNEDSPTHHRYKGGNLINAQKLVDDSCVTYRLTFDLHPVCKEIVEPCPREACTVQVKQHQQGNIDASKDSIQCMYLFPQSMQDDKVQTQESIGEQPQENAGNADKINISNQSIELDHEIQSSGDQNDKPFIAMRASGSKYCPGCPYDLNPKLPGLAAFGDEAVKWMDELLPNDYKHKVFDILKVTRAVPPSSNVIQYKVIFQIGETDCLKNAIVSQGDCSLQPNIQLKTCLVTFEEEPWQQSARQIVQNNCTLDQLVKPVEGTTAEAGFHTEPLLATAEQEKISALEGLRGLVDISANNGPTGVEPEISRLSEVTEPSIVKVVLNRSEDNEEPASFADKMKEFGDFLEEFRIPNKAEVSDSRNDRAEIKDEGIFEERILSRNASNEIILRDRRNTNVGAPNSRNVTDPEIQEFARKALSKFSENLEGPNEPIIVEVTEASAQVVAGMLYKIKVRLGTSNCSKGVKENCMLKADSEVKECLFSVWSRPWINEQPEIEINCNLGQRRKRSLRGSNYSQKMLQQVEDLKAEPLFEDFIKTHSKTYSSAKEKETRYKIFKNNLRVINELRKYEQGTAIYGVTMFADLTYDEFKNYLGLRPDLQSENEIPRREATIPDIDLPEKFDWRDHGVVTPVKNQGACGSCWAFSVTGNVEGQYAIKYNKLLSLSEQELVDCDSLDEGCNGGLPDSAYRAIENLGGLELESDYPYDARNEKCHFNPAKAEVKLVSAVNISTNEEDMAKWLTKNGPISIGINANAMQFYIGGVSHPFKFLCNPNNLDHGVLIVGYAKSSYPLFHKELPYWIVKNSWGPRWGEQGYYRVYRGDGTCGVNQMASSAVVA